MKDFLIDQFLTEVRHFEAVHSQEELVDLRLKSNELINGLCSMRLILHDPGTYALIFIVGSSPVYFQTFFQIKSALKMLLCFIEKDKDYLDLTENELPELVNYIIGVKHEIRFSYQLFHHFFEQKKEDQERIQCTIKNLRWMYSQEGVLKQIESLFESIDEELEYISGLIQDLKTDEIFKLYFGKEKDVLENGLNQLLAEKSAEKAMQTIQGQIKENFEEVNAHLDVFKPNGFRLFEYLMKNHLSSGAGWQSDVSFFYRMMEERDKLIHVKQNRFKEFLEENYPHLEPMGKFKVWNDIGSEKRKQIYLAAKKAIGLK